MASYVISTGHGVLDLEGWRKSAVASLLVPGTPCYYEGVDVEDVLRFARALDLVYWTNEEPDCYYLNMGRRRAESILRDLGVNWGEAARFGNRLAEAIAA